MKAGEDESLILVEEPAPDFTFPTLLVLILVLFAVTASTFAFALLRAIGSRYQESVFLFGVAFVVLAFAVFTYRFYGYPDRRRESTEED